MSQTDQTTDEVLDSLTGHEEMAIAQHFGRTVGEMIPEPGMYRRALIFVVKRHEGLNEDEARNAALDMRLKDVLEFFPQESAEADPEAERVVEESGKDEPQPEPQREISLSSVS
jgi:hypothetical protein